MNIFEILRAQATSNPTAAAIIDTHRGRRRITTFSEMEKASARVAAQLHRAGLQPGQAVLVFQPMSVELYVVLSAIFRLGLVAMFIDPGQGKAHIEQCCALCRPRALIASAKAQLLGVVSPAVRDIPLKFVITGSGKLGDWSVAALARTVFQGVLTKTPEREQNLELKFEESFDCSADTPALLTFTSGSTGRPKAALRTHGFLVAQYRMLAKSLDMVDQTYAADHGAQSLRSERIDLATMPIVTLVNLAKGITSVIPDVDLRYPGQADPASIVAQIQSEQVTSTVASPALLEQLARYCLARNTVLPALSRIFSGGAPVYPRLLDQLQDIAPNAVITVVYGSTEAEPMAKISRHQLHAEDIEATLNGRGLLAGAPVETIQLKIVEEQWGRPRGPYSEAEFAGRCLPAEQVGEIVVSGAHVLSGYLNGHGDAETKFRVASTVWHRTGDAGYLDAQGRLWLLGRCAAVIKDEHGMLYPFAAECAMTRHPEIRRSAMVCHNGRRIMAIELNDPRTNPHLAALQDTVAWAHIDEIRVYRQLPVDKRHNAKIDYPALYKMLAKDSN